MRVSTKARSIYPAIFLVAGLYVFIANFELLSPILLSFCLILLVALALNPVVLRLRRLFSRRDVATAVMALVFLIFLAGAAWAFYSPLKRSVGQFVHNLPTYWKKIEAPIQKFERQAAAPIEPGKAAPAPAPATGFHFDGMQLYSSVGKGLQALIANTAGLAMVAITVFVGVLYTLLNPRPLFRAFFGLVPEEHHGMAVRIACRVSSFVPRWALAMITGMAIIGGLVFLAMWPIFGFQDAVLLGLISFTLEAIPYVGAVVSGIPALLLALGQGSGTGWVVIAYVTIQLVEHNVISPIIVAGPLRQHPVAVIFSVLFCIPTFGVLGVLLAVPLVATLQIFYDELFRPRFLPTTSNQDLDRMARETLDSCAFNATPTLPAPGVKKTHYKAHSLGTS
ncbi:MAG TPA: AI-2E family transporter [Candidatus Saccharimonadales bacterium]|nr:AI-2E family transporter [Candidatus Saccharimonadales bacterium]